MHPGDVGIQLLRGWTGLQDAFTEAKHFEVSGGSASTPPGCVPILAQCMAQGSCSQGCEDGCTLIPNNCFAVKSELQPFPLGIRIDYILYKVTGSLHAAHEAEDSQ